MTRFVPFINSLFFYVYICYLLESLSSSFQNVVFLCVFLGEIK